MRIVFLLFFFLSFLFGQEKLIIAKFENLKPYYYNNQIVELKLKIISAINGKIIIKDDNNLTYFNDNNLSDFIDIKFNLKNKFPIFTIKIENNVTSDELNITPNSKIKQLYPPKNFCGVLANEFNVSDKILTNYDDDNNILYFNIQTDGNLDDFSLKFNNEKLFKTGDKLYTFSALVPLNHTNFIFSYFDLKDERYKNIDFNLKIKNYDISTQTDIKPITKSNIYIINTILLVLIILWGILFFYRKKIIYIILIIISFISLIFFNYPKPTIILKEGQKVHILPFEKSTIFLVMGMDTKVEVLKVINGYKKIKFNNHIGWVKEEKK